MMTFCTFQKRMDTADPPISSCFRFSLLEKMLQ